MALDHSPFRLTIPSDPSLLVAVRTFVAAVCQAGGIDQPATDAVVLAVNEAVNNVIRHAHGTCPDAPIQVQCALCPTGIEILILDEGGPFDLAAVPHLDPGELRIGGRGVFLMRTLMDELNCRPREGRGNILRMVKRCAVHSPAPDGH